MKKLNLIERIKVLGWKMGWYDLVWIYEKTLYEGQEITAKTYLRTVYCDHKEKKWVREIGGSKFVSLESAGFYPDATWRAWAVFIYGGPIPGRPDKAPRKKWCHLGDLK